MRTPWWQVPKESSQRVNLRRLRETQAAATYLNRCSKNKRIDERNSHLIRTRKSRQQKTLETTWSTANLIMKNLRRLQAAGRSKHISLMGPKPLRRDRFSSSIPHQIARRMTLNPWLQRKMSRKGRRSWASSCREIRSGPPAKSLSQWHHRQALCTSRIPLHLTKNSNNQ